MANEFYEQGKNRAARVQALFDHIAPRYDLINDLQSFGLHRVWKRRLVALAAVRPGDQALDLCCGTGDLAFALARAGASVTGVDFNQRMLARAQARLAQTPSPKPPRFLQGDAENLQFPDRSFDIVTVGYGLRNLGSWEKGLQEMCRVAKPGARLLVLDFGKPDQPLWRTIYFTYLRLFVPVLGKLFCGSWSAYSYILESLHHYPAQNGVAGKMTALGLEAVEIENIFGGVMAINKGQIKSSLP